jgi:hypothetical protein
MNSAADRWAPVNIDRSTVDKAQSRLQRAGSGPYLGRVGPGRAWTRVGLQCCHVTKLGSY